MKFLRVQVLLETLVMTSYAAISSSELRTFEFQNPALTASEHPNQPQALDNVTPKVIDATDIDPGEYQLGGLLDQSVCWAKLTSCIHGLVRCCICYFNELNAVEINLRNNAIPLDYDSWLCLEP